MWKERIDGLRAQAVTARTASKRRSVEANYNKRSTTYERPTDARRGQFRIGRPGGGPRTHARLRSRSDFSVVVVVVVVIVGVDVVVLIVVVVVVIVESEDRSIDDITKY